jgi:hypothetical protein
MVMLRKEDKEFIVKEYEEHLTPMAHLASAFGVSRQAIWKVLKSEGVDTSKRLIKVVCAVCGKDIWRNKARVRKSNSYFCDMDCYRAWLQSGQGEGQFNAWRHGQRIARRKVSEVFDLGDFMIVHHKDRNQYHNRIENLMVFRNQGDHVRHHRGIEVEVLFDGDNLS